MKRRGRYGLRILSDSKRVLLVVIIFVLLVFIFKNFKLLKEKKQEYNSKIVSIEKLNEEINIENSREQKLDDSKNQLTSDEEYESLAREELGLIRRDEIVIKPR